MDKKKKLLISATAAVLAAAIGVGTWFGIRTYGGDPVYVYEFMNVGMTEFWGDSQESYGPVSSDNIQTVFLSKTQEITDILVKEGDQVKKGDLLMTFDTTLSAIDLERKRLEVEKLKLQLEDEKRELQKINAMRPMQIPSQQPDSGQPEPNLGEELQSFRIYTADPENSNGASPETPLICWVRDDAFLTKDLMKVLLWTAAELQIQLLPDPTDPSEATDPTEDKQSKPSPAFPPEVLQELESPTPIPEGDTETPDVTPDAGGEGEILPPPEVPQEDMTPEGEGVSMTLLREAQLYRKFRTTQQVTFEAMTEIPLLPQGAQVLRFQGSSVNGTIWYLIQYGEVLGWVQKDALEAQPVPTDPLDPTEGNPDIGGNEGGSGGNEGGNGGEEGGAPTDPAVPTDPTVPANPIEKPENMEPVLPTETARKCYVVIRITDGNRRYGSHQVWQGIQLNRSGDFRFFNAMAVPDYFMAQNEEDQGTADLPDIDFGSGLTAGQIAQLREEQKGKIKEADFKVRMAEAEYKIKKRELEDGNITAEFDGEVVSLLSEEEARKTKKPLMKVSGGGGFYVEGTVGELDRETMEIGMEVTINDWNNGEMYTGKVVSVGDFPSGAQFYGGGNPNSSEYPFEAFVDGTADLQAGSFVSIQYASGGSEHGVYLENPFLRTENGQSYVYVMGEKNRLEKRIVKTGKSLWGSYTEILSGLTEEDLVAFPYGKNVKPGAKAEPGDISQLYQ